MKPAAYPEPVQCERMGKLLADFVFHTEFYHRPFLRLKADVEVQLRTYFYAVAICHQTYHLHSKKLNLWGWDYMEDVFTKLSKTQPYLLQPGVMATMQTEKLQQELAELFSDSGLPDQTTLDRLEERASFLIEADILLATRFNDSLLSLFESTGYKLINNGLGIYEILTGFTAYSDPFKKKITFLLKLLEEAKLIKVADPENFIPIMDYHMQRVLLRTGCVEISDPLLAERLRKQIPLNNDMAVREACIEAFSVISGKSGLAVIKLNDVFWSLGRSCCNVTMLCETGHCEKQPCTFEQIIDLPSHKECALAPICKGALDENYRKFWQPVVDTHYY